MRMNCVKLVGAVAAAPLGRGRSEEGVGSRPSWDGDEFGCLSSD